MIARFFGIAFFMVSLPGRMVQPAAVAAELPLRCAQTEVNVSATNIKGSPSKDMPDDLPADRDQVVYEREYLESSERSQ